MPAYPYLPPQPGAQRITIAQAAVEHIDVPPARKELVAVVDGMPYLALDHRVYNLAAEILVTARLGEIRGRVWSEDGYPLPVDQVRLDAASVDVWCAIRAARLVAEEEDI